MAKPERKPERKGRKPHSQPYEKLLDTLATEIDPKISDANPPVHQKEDIMPTGEGPYTFHISTSDVAQITGCADGESAETSLVAKWLLNGALNVMAHGAREPEFSKLLPVQKMLLLNSGPRTPVEAMLLIQMISAHEMAMTFASHAVSEQDAAISASDSSRAERLMALFVRQAECLQKLKGLSGQQKVVVEHLNVTAGGKAVVGQVIGKREEET